MEQQAEEDLVQPFGDSVLSNLFMTFVRSNLEARMDRGELPEPYPLSQLRAIQIVFSPDGGLPKVRINSEVRAIVKVRPKKGREFGVGDPVSNDQIESIDMISLTNDEADFGHATFIRNADGGWFGYFDFVYFKGTARRHVEVASQFLDAARVSRAKNNWIAFADTLYSAVELAAKASLYCLNADKNIATTKKHQIVHAQFNKQRHIGNVDPKHANALNHLWKARQKGRYIEEDVSFSNEEADELLSSVESLIEQAQQRCASIAEVD